MSETTTTIAPPELNREDFEARLRHATDMYDRGAPIMSDEQFDAEKAQFALAFDEPLVYLGRSGLTPDSKTVAHVIPMLSIGKAQTYEQVKAFFLRLINTLGFEDGLDVTATSKDDGMAMRLAYYEGDLRQGVSRGTGTEGDDLTPHLRHVSNLPQKIEQGGDMEVRGELAMSWASMSLINQGIIDEGGDPDKDCYTHPRNAVAGILRQSKPEPSLLKHVRFEAYRLVTRVERITTHMDELDWLRDKGFDVTMVRRYDVKDLIGLDTEELIAELTDFRSHQVPIDGVVLRANSCALFDNMGYDDESYLGAIAFKFPAEMKRTKLLKIDYQGPGRSGTLNPVGLIEPTKLEGVTISKATACNLARVAKYGLHPGVEVGIRRANEVIPELLGCIAGKLVYEDRTGKKPVLRYLETKEPVPTLMIPPVSSIDYPRECPGCGGATVYRAPHLRCENPSCKPKLKALISYLGHRERLDLRGLGKAVAEALVDSELITDPLGVFRLDVETLTNLQVKGKGFGEKRAQQIYRAIGKAKEKPFAYAFKALGCPGLGADVIKQFEARGWGICDLITKACTEPEAAKAELQSLPGIGPVTASDLVDWLIEERLWLWYMPEYLHLKPEVREAGDAPLADKNFVITGEFPDLGIQRDGPGGIKDKIGKLGGAVKSAVSRKTHYLIQGVGGVGTGKHSDAMALGTPVLNVNGLKKVLEGRLDFDEATDFVVT